MLHAERRICTTDAAGVRSQQGAIILHVALRLRNAALHHVAESLLRGRCGRRESRAEEGTAGGNVDVAIYGWGLQPLYTSGRSAWPITDALFAPALRARASRSGRGRRTAA